MKLISRHLLDEGYPIPLEAVVRINLRWEPSLEYLCKQIEAIPNDVFLDFPKHPSKPPGHRWNISQLLFVFNTYPHVKYCAVSNVEEPEDLGYALWKLPRHVNIVPKIESTKAIQNIDQIINELKDPKIIMVDTDDLYADMIRQSLPVSEMYTKYINPLYDKSEMMNFNIWKVSGIMFDFMKKRVG